ncbi:hypothetical protein [Psychrobacter phenylpyruvicus]|uniref:Pili assembly chaperone N-terminal domain-containing protein n=1 Tax=Psychrobacter phenylpyruvicus TaxID=29432 RepID=A0A379LNQ9_9GAMM|nr:hypothetical protein [Psychrobacter phenylpyruvicus]SUD91507.1 Uncharacterised protein [Psychrobacter phenylpyruvicus]
MKLTTPSKLSKSFLSLSFITISLFTASSAHAELIIHTSKDASGLTSMVVNQDKQKDLPPAQLGITPARIDETISLKQNKNTSRLNQSVTLYNYGTKPKKIRLNLIDMDATGKPVEPSETTLKPWTLINPTEFTIAPGGYQTVRMAIRLPIQFPAGKHGAMLSIEQQVDKSLTYDADGKGVTLEIGSRYGLPVFINVE